MKHKILIFTEKAGHLSLAKAAESFLKDLPDTKIKMVNLMDEKIAWGFYRISYRFFPQLTKLPFEISKKNENLMEAVRNYLVLKYRKKILDCLKKERPDIIITTYFGYIPVLDEIKAISNFRLINIVSDPVSVHPLLLSKEADFNIGFERYFLETAKNVGLKIKALSAGWLVRKAFFEKIDKEETRRKYNLEDKLTVLVCGGSEGSNAIIWLLPFLFFSRMKKDFQIIFICGNNKTLKNMINSTYRIAKKINPKIPKILVIGFTNKLHEFMAISDVVVGKAGPNLMFESISMGKPFLAITHISGQEDGNLKLIKERKFGWVAEDPVSASKVLKEVIENPSVLKRFKHLKKFSEENYKTGLKLAEIVNKMINN